MLTTLAQKTKIKTFWRTKITRPVIISFILFILVSVLASYTGYNYLSANIALAKCDKAFSEKQYIKAAKACEKSASLWHRDEAVEKADKSHRIYKSNNYYFDGLEAFSNSEWEKALGFLRAVIKEDPNYPDAVEKIALAKENEEKENSKKVAGAQDKAENNPVNSIPVVTRQPSASKKTVSIPKTDATTKKKISSLEKKIADLEKTTKVTPPTPITLSLNPSEISAIVQIVCIVDYVNEGDFSLAFGSGTIYHPDGYILTNKHVVQNSNGTVSPTICLVGVTDTISEPPDYKYLAFLYAYSASKDVADLTIYEATEGNILPTSFNFLSFGSSDNLAVGDDVWMAGYPDTGGATFTLTKGIISGRSGDFIKTDAEISFGNSGGTALNKDKKYVGIPTAGSFLGLGTLAFVIGIDDVLNISDWINLY